MAITAKDVQKLREMTGVGMMDCKKALTEAEGDFDKAIEWLREKGLAAQTKKAGKVAAEGVSYAIVADNGVGVVIEVNSQTDFVAKNEVFQDFVKTLASIVANENPADVEALKACTYPGTDRTVADVTADKVLAIGISQRTEPDAIDMIARNIFASEDSTINTVLAFNIPNSRAFMHLDTVFTQIDVDKFTVHPGILGPLQVFEITPGADDELKVREIDDTLENILAKYLGLPKVTLIQCAGGDTIAAEREQWNDGSNTLCIAPGVIVVYERNDVTNAILREAGLKVLEMPSAELSRGRGGPRCMSMPLIRED